MEWDLGGISQRSASQLQERLHGSSPTYAEVVDFRSRAWSLCEMRRGENWNWAPRISYTHQQQQLQIRSGPIQHSLWAAGLHRNRGMSRRIGRASFACCRARRVDKLTTISMRYHLDEICLHWREMMVNVLSGARRRSIVVVLVVAIVVVVVA